MDSDGVGNARQGEGDVVAVGHQSPVPDTTTATPDASTGLTSTSSPSLPHPTPSHPTLNSTKAEPTPPPPASQRGPSTADQQQQQNNNNNNNSRRRSLPFAFPPLFFRSNTSSTSLAPSTAEGKPIPVDDTTAAHRISALKKLNSSYPSAAAGGRGHTYAKSTGAQSSTYSQPVLVRTYSGPSPAQSSYGGVRSSKHHQQQSRSSRYRPPSSSRGISRRVPLPLSSKSGSDLSSRPTKPALSGGVGLGNSTTNSNSNSNSGNSGNLSSSRSEGIITGSINSSSSSNRTNSTTTTNERLTTNMPHHHHKSKKSSTSSTASGGGIVGGLGSKLPLSWGRSRRSQQEEAKLPPLEAFSFKSFMADLQSQGGGGGSSGENDIGADLDRIAEICARSRYSLSSQYEMHVAPHGSGISFITGGPGSRRNKGHSHSRTRSGGAGVGGGGGGGGGNGPTLQAIGSDDDNESARSHHQRGNKRRSGGGGGGRRRSVAYGTLETIMSSSRSSEEDKTKKKSAAEIVGEVRGRAARKAGWDNSTSVGSGDSNSNSNSNETTQGEAGSQGGVVASVAGRENTASQTQNQSRTSEGGSKARLARKKSASFATAVMDSSRNQYHGHGHSHTGSSSNNNSSKNDVTPSSSASALISEPALPQTSTSHLGVRTATANVPTEDLSTPPSPGGQVEVHLADDLPHQQPTTTQTQYSYGEGHNSAPIGRTSTRSLHPSTYSHSSSGIGGWSTWIPIPAWSGRSTTTTTANTDTPVAALETPRGDAGIAGVPTSTSASASAGISNSGNNRNNRSKRNAEGSLRQLLKSA